VRAERGNGAAFESRSGVVLAKHSHGDGGGKTRSTEPVANEDSLQKLLHPETHATDGFAINATSRWSSNAMIRLTDS
jgi:hypothetical protein